MTPEAGPVVTIGESLALLTADEPGVVSRGQRYRLGFGGAESNVAIGLVRLGTPAAWIGRVGDDENGRMILRELRAEGVDVRASVEPDRPTALMLKQRRTPTTQRVEYLRRGSAGSSLSIDDVGPERLADARWIHLTGITPALSDSARDTVDAVLDTAAAPISLDINYRSALWSPDQAAAFIRARLERVEVLFGGLEEISMVLGRVDLDPADAARAVLDLGARIAVVKLGADGAVEATPDRVVHSPAIPINPLDTVGAGDAFVAGWIAERLAGSDADARLALANRAGALACLSPGDWDGYGRRDELALLDQREAVIR